MKLIKLMRRAVSNVLSGCWRIYARARRAMVDPSACFKGRPLIRCAKGSRITIGRDVKINSSVAANPVSCGRRTALCTAAPGAILEMGPESGASGVTITAAIEVRIGEGTLLGADSMISDTDFHVPLSGHRWGNDMTSSAAPVRIGRGCFIGARAVILKGVTIGDGAVVGAGAVVVQDVPAGSLAAGNPARVRQLPSRWRHPVEKANEEGQAG